MDTISFKLAKEITHFTIQFHLKNLIHLRTSTHLTLKIICSRNTAKYLFQQTWVCLVTQKMFAPFLDAQELHSWSTLKANVCIFPYISVRKCLCQRRSKILSDGERVGGRLNNFLNAAYEGQAPHKMFYNFSF